MKKQILTLAICLFVCITASQAQNEINGYEYVDLGLPSGLKWATCNVGANSSSEYGNYYAWGETETKSEYTENNSKTYAKYMGDIKGNSQYDAARANWGGTWRLPTKAEFDELIVECTWRWTIQDSINGYKVTGPNGNSTFFPAAGYRSGKTLYNIVDMSGTDKSGTDKSGVGQSGLYWSSTPNESNTHKAYFLGISSVNHYTDWIVRDFGLSVRPVSE